MTWIFHFRHEFKEFVTKNLPAKLSDGYVVVEDADENQSFHQSLYKYSELGLISISDDKYMNNK